MAQVRNVRGGGHETHLGTEDARQASRTGYMWRVLALSVLFGAVVVLAAWLWASHPVNRPDSMGGGNVHAVAKPQSGPLPATAAGSSDVAQPSPQSHDTGT